VPVITVGIAIQILLIYREELGRNPRRPRWRKMRDFERPATADLRIAVGVVVASPRSSIAAS